jgi:ubiquinone/menaquinone biosynthesis C-methylase UbiE
MSKKKYSQDDINVVWAEEWQAHTGVSTSMLFGSPLFEEGYKVYQNYFPKGAKNVLEIGGGSGRYGLAIARDNPQYMVTLTDPLEDSVKIMQQSGQDLQLQNVSYAVADMCVLPYPDNHFDVIFADGVIQHIIDIDTAMNEARRVLKPGGVIIISAVNSWNPFHRSYKTLLQICNKEYEYGYEHTYSRAKLHECFLKHAIPVVALDGFYVAYGMYRWGYRYRFFKPCSRFINRCIKIVDRFTGRFLSKRFGFMLFCVGTK